MEEVCQICDKVFANKKALGGHMRIHYRKQTLAVDVDNSEKNGVGVGVAVSCQQCGKSFPTARSLAGHMKVHSKILDDYSETGKKRRSSEWAAETLMMLSNDVRETIDDYDYYGDSEIGLSSGSLDVGDDDFDFKLDARNKTKVSVDTSRDIIKKRRLNEAGSELHCANDSMGPDSSGETDMDEDVSEVVYPDSCGKSGVLVRNQDASKGNQFNSRKDGVVGSVSLNSSKSKDQHECPICLKVFSSGQAMGGHKRSHFA